MRPLGGEQHRGQVSARGVAGDVDSVRIAADLRGVIPDPRERLPVLLGDGVHGHVRAQVVVVEHHAGTRLDEALRHEPERRRVECAPVAAVNEEQDRRAAAPRPDVEPFQCAVSEGHVEPALEPLDDPGGFLFQAGEGLGEVGAADPHVVLEIEALPVVSPVDRLAHADSCGGDEGRVEEASRSGRSVTQARAVSNRASSRLQARSACASWYTAESGGHQPCRVPA